MSKEGPCSCGKMLIIPRTECMAGCSLCGTISLFLCHVIPEVTDPMHIRCKQCKSLHSIITCPQCQATTIVKDFASGHVYLCVCGFKSTLVNCNKCVGLLCLPTRKNYEDTKITCKKCQSQFKFVCCPACGECIYLKPTQQKTDIQFCYNENCERSEKQLYRQKPAGNLVSSEAIGNRVEKLPKEDKVMASSPYETYPSFAPKEEKELCKICLNKQSSMINTTCFHLAVCEPCSYNLNGRCPICRQEGNYKKVFKS